MIINFRQGIVSYDTSIFPFTAAASVGGVDITLNIGTQPFVVSIANQTANYLWSESLTVDAWPNLSPSGTYWLYFEFNQQTFARTFGTSTLAPINQSVAPISPAIGQHWYNTATSQMFVWSGSVWNPVLRLFVAKFIGPSMFVSLSINSPSFQGTTVGNTTPNISAGRVLVDSSGYPILKHDGTFFTTEDQSFAQGSAINGVRLESNVFTAQSASPSIIPVYEVVAFNPDGTVRIANYNDAGPTAIALALQQINFASTGAVLLEGTVTNPLWNWAGHIGSLLWVSGVIPGTLQDTDPHLDNPVVYQQARVPVARVIGPTSIIFLQGIGTKGDPGPSGSASVSLATSISPGTVFLSVDAGALPSPTPIVVSELDPRLSNARTPLPHNQAASTIVVTPSGTITSTNAQAAFQELDTNKLAIAGGTMTGNLILNADPTIPLQAATKQYVDAEVATVQTGLFNPTSGGLILTTDGTTRSVASNAKLYLQLPAGSGLTQDTTGLYIASGSITNAMLTNSTVPVDVDGVGTTTMTLGSTFNVFGTANQINTTASANTVTIALAPVTNTGGGSLVKVATDGNGRVTGTSAVVASDILALNLVIPYDLCFFIPGNMTTATMITGGYLSSRAITIPAGASGSLAVAGTAPASSTVYSIQKNGTQVGTITFVTTTGTISIPSQVNLATGDILNIVTPGTIDASIQNVYITLVGSAIAALPPLPPPSTTVTLVAPGVNSGNGPLFDGEMNGVSDGLVSGGPPNYNNGSSVGSSITGTVFGATVAAIVFEDGFGNFKTEVVLHGSHPQNFFSSMTFTDTTPALETFTSASATYAVITGTNGTFTYWQWNAIEHYPFGFGPNVVVTFNS